MFFAIFVGVDGGRRRLRSLTGLLTVLIVVVATGPATQAGSIESWGYDDDGQVSATPAGTGFKAIAGGSYHSLALRADGSIVSWGNDVIGLVSATPAGTGFKAIAGGGAHS